MTELKFVNNEYTPLRDVVFANLRQSIITGELKPGQRLMEIKLSQDMGVSRTPVREAIKKLQTEGLVIIHARKGAVVAPIDPDGLKEILEVRSALERLVCVLNCERATGTDLTRMKEINSEMADAVKHDDVQKIAEKDVEFHELLSEIAGNSILSDMLKQLKAHLLRYRLEFIKELEDRGVLVNDHKAIIEEIEKKDPPGVAKEIQRHIDRQANYILATLEK